MPEYTYSGPEIILPDIPLLVSDGDTVTLPRGFYTKDQALAIGFTPIGKTETGSEPAHADPQQ